MSRSITGPAPLFGTMAATAVLVALHWILAKLATHSPLADRLLEGQAVQLGTSGILHEEELKKWSVSGMDVAEAMRQSGVARFDEIGSVTLEPSGKISVSKAEG